MLHELNKEISTNWIYGSESLCRRLKIIAFSIFSSLVKKYINLGRFLMKVALTLKLLSLLK